MACQGRINKNTLIAKMIGLFKERKLSFRSMEDPRLKIGDPRYPPSLQKAFIGYFLGTFQSFTDEEIDELTEFFRQLWVMREQQGVRLELIKVLKLVLAKKIEDEKHMLRDQLKKLESM